MSALFTLKRPVVTVKTVYIWFLSAVHDRKNLPTNIGLVSIHCCTFKLACVCN